MLHLTAKKIDVQNPIIENIISQVNANQIGEKGVKELFAKAEDDKIRRTLEALRRQDDEDGGGGGGSNRKLLPPPLFIYLIHCLNSITRSCKTDLHRASIKTLHIKLTEYHIIGLCREPIFQS